MAYIRRMIGQDEKLIGIARLHWIYIAQGILWFIGCVAFARFLDSGFSYLLSFFPESSAALAVPIVALSSWLTPFALFFGAILCSLHVVKVLTTEIGMTDRRIIYKRGWLFVNTREIDIGEISGENMDMGYLGRILNYGYIHLDCRFIGDIHLPAINKPAGFLKALHKKRTEIPDMVPVMMGEKKAVAVTEAEGKAGKPTLDRDTPDLQKDEHLDQTEVIAKAVAEAMQRMPATPAAATTPGASTPAAAVDPVTVAAIVEQVVPAMAERVAEKVTEKVAEKVSEEIEAKAAAPIPPPADMPILPDMPAPQADALAPALPADDESRLELEGPNEELLEEFDDAATAQAANQNKSQPNPQQAIR